MLAEENFQLKKQTEGQSISAISAQQVRLEPLDSLDFTRVQSEDNQRILERGRLRVELHQDAFIQRQSSFQVNKNMRKGTTLITKKVPIHNELFSSQSTNIRPLEETDDISEGFNSFYKQKLNYPEEDYNLKGSRPVDAVASYGKFQKASYNKNYMIELEDLTEVQSEEAFEDDNEARQQ